MGKSRNTRIQKYIELFEKDIKINTGVELVSEKQLIRRRVSLSTPVLMSALFTYHNLTILLKACNSIFDEIAHAILLQLIHI